MIGRRRQGALLVTMGAVTALAGTFMSWVRSGSQDRSSYAIFELVERLGFAPGGIVAGSVRAWPLVPLLLALTTVGVWVWDGSQRMRWPTGVVAVATVVWVGGTATAVALAPSPAGLPIGNGPLVTVVGVAVLAVGAIVSLRESGSSAAS